MFGNHTAGRTPQSDTAYDYSSDLTAAVTCTLRNIVLSTMSKQIEHVQFVSTLSKR